MGYLWDLTLSLVMKRRSSSSTDLRKALGLIGDSVTAQDQELFSFVLPRSIDPTDSSPQNLERIAKAMSKMEKILPKGEAGLAWRSRLVRALQASYEDALRTSELLTDSTNQVAKLTGHSANWTPEKCVARRQRGGSRPQMHLIPPVDELPLSQSFKLGLLNTARKRSELRRRQLPLDA